MQIKGLPRNLQRLASYAEKHPQHHSRSGYERFSEPVERWKQLKSEGVSDEGCERIVGISRATFYRYQSRIKQNNFKIKPRRINKRQWGESEKQKVLQIRRDDPTFGKQKITIILKRDFTLQISESTVGRILTHLKEKGLITRSASAFKTRRKRQFKRHAQPWKYKKYAEMVLGERVQVDHMTVNKNGCCVKHFQAWERKSKYMAAQVYSHATCRSAKKFLLEFLDQVPYKVLSIQVDGGSEFMADFEDACAELNIPLIVLPPSKPTYNGGVERGNRIFREEFYNTNKVQSDSVGGVRNELREQVRKYNTYRPHRALNGKTPMEYIDQHFNSEVAA